jgi:hypothetical protein
MVWNQYLPLVLQRVRLVQTCGVRLTLLKLKYLPKYWKASPILIFGISCLLISSLGRCWIDFVRVFFMPNVLHLSTRIIMLDHWHQMENRFRRCWFSDSWLLMTAASSANWNQWTGFRNCKEKPNWRYLSVFMCCIKVLKHILKRRGLRQSPCNTPRRTGMKGVGNSDVIIEVLKSVYRLLIINLTCSGIWW